MKCPHCQNLAADADKVCFSCKRYMGNERASDKIGGETDYSRLMPLIFVVIGVPLFHMTLPKYYVQLIRYDTYDWPRMIYSALAGGVFMTVGWIVGRLLGDGRTVRI
jgi:hypothetical protein